MTVEIRVPVLGESVTEATVGQWFKKVGESVAKDEPLLELETDKVTLEVNATEAGRLDEIVVAEGEDVEVGALLGQIAEGAAGSAAEKAPEVPKEEAVEKPAEAPAPKEEAAPAAASTSATKVEVLPAAQKLIDENNLDAGKLRGTGKDGRITKGDVLEALENGGASPAAPAPATAPAAAPAPAAPSGPRAEEAREERVKMTRLRKSIAARLKDAQNTAAMLTTYNEVDMTGMLDLRAEYKELFLKKHGVKLGFMSFFTKACIAALQETPAVNAEIDGDDLVYKNYYNMGIAVGTDSGLVVPVLRDADQLSFAEVEKGIGALGKKARDGKLSMADLQGGTFTITNGGVYGSLMSSPILNPPQAAVLGMHKIQERPMVIKGEIKVRPMMYLALTYDHRIIDGKEAVTFLVRVKDALEDPQRLLLDL
ncbi:2-oxoglutarate dehydrogenase complex dihydrolipoyllysine-residue succinyltransferase [Sneathiella sp.]|uniref:2-oxoglutarate dehydrogenase complex dihydrolipoyllysine-residue succinyltransferase n=1 Tax=Sneathiella sp. TaxID=1964365 RepID=UPI00261A06D2|nr:2-oxoglutarate dehydrogenase complex dihydrolipoyllysine-residue succinyltransferase [Sneathiella sp.]MDF2366413.1 2-oxoglutarate dehydrogenase complex dihydrolipoyllysine-residue succinyltransferase [Sneathiella sp.]